MEVDKRKLRNFKTLPGGEVQGRGGKLLLIAVNRHDGQSLFAVAPAAGMHFRQTKERRATLSIVSAGKPFVNARSAAGMLFGRENTLSSLSIVTTGRAFSL